MNENAGINYEGNFLHPLLKLLINYELLISDRSNHLSRENSFLLEP